MIAGRKHECQREEDLDRHLGRSFPRTLTSLVAHLVRLCLQDTTDGQAERVGLRTARRQR